MANMVQAEKKIAILHRYTKDQIRETNAAFPFLVRDGVDVLTFKKFERLHNVKKIAKSILWILYSPLLVIGRGYSVIYCDDSFPFYPALVKLASPRSKVIKRMGDFHLMYYVTGIWYHMIHWLEIIEWRMVDAIIAISKPMQDHIISEIDTSKKPKVWVVLDPVDPLDFPIYQGEPHQTVMFHGLLTRNKNVDVLLAAAERMPGVLFKIVGDGPDRDRLEDLAPVNVQFTGWIPFHKIVRILNTCSVGVALRSDNPGNDYVVTSPFLQYSILAKPCLVTRRQVYGDYPWQFTGVDDLIHGINELLARPEEGKKMREYVLQHHSAKLIGEQLWKLLSQYAS
jgi:glycosyltransferase involved in cell wall biosynthesis